MDGGQGDYKKIFSTKLSVLNRYRTQTEFQKIISSTFISDTKNIFFQNKEKNWKIPEVEKTIKI